ncbi:MAG TPA: hypothetical protein PKA06_07575, partial [Gemmatales bacterium]|nr:hypothetical protein [Gemmatales bacterium]
YTGCPLEAMVLGRDKVRTKFLMRGQGIPTADFQVVYSKDDIKPVASWPLFVKPAATDASLGIDQKSVVTSKDTLQAKVAELNDRYGVPVILETYLPGTEFNVGVVEIPQRTCLPIAEMVYTPQQGVSWPIVSYASKWVTGSPEDLAMQPRCPAQISEELSAQLQEIALKAFTLAGCQDVARVDIRLDEQGQPQVLEVNPNPDLGPQAGLARMLKVYGLAYDAFINQLVTNHL